MVVCREDVGDISFLRKGEVLACVGRIHSLRDLKDKRVQTALRGCRGAAEREREREKERESERTRERERETARAKARESERWSE